MKYLPLSTKKILCLSLISMITISATSCRLPGMPDKDPANTLRSYYREGEYDKAISHYITYKLIAETSEISYPGVEVRTLPSQKDSGLFENVKHTLYHIAISDLSSSEGYYPLLTLDILSDADWEIDTENTIIAQHDDKVLAQVCYGAGKFATILYSIKDDTFMELKPDSKFWPYQNGILSGDEPYILADTISYDVTDYSTIRWYDWNGFFVKSINNARTFYHNDTLHYIVCTEKDGMKQFDIYSADYDGSNEKHIGSIQEGRKNSNIVCYYDVKDAPVIECHWIAENGEKAELSLPFDQFSGTTVCK